MKLLKIQVNGLKLFQEELIIDFFAKQRVNSEKNEMLTNVFSNIYINNVISIAGINASGKTSTLKVISFVLQMLKNEPINNITFKNILEGINEEEDVVFNIYFTLDDDKIRKLHTVINMRHDMDEPDRNKYFISSESLFEKSRSSVRSKNDLFEFSNVKPINERNNKELFLLDDVSIIVALNKQKNDKMFIGDQINWTNLNGLRLMGEFPIELIHFLDPSIEYLKFPDFKLSSKKYEMILKFYNKNELTIHSPIEVNNYLSSGTIKGINVFLTAFTALKKGGYILVDELENHFNKEIVSTLIRFFMDSNVNKHGAVLIFSTHYVELLDIFERNDNIFIVKNKKGITIENLSDILNRNDIKKSDLFQSGYLEDTTPSYESYINLKRVLTSEFWRFWGMILWMIIIL